MRLQGGERLINVGDGVRGAYGEAEASLAAGNGGITNGGDKNPRGAQLGSDFHGSLFGPNDKRQDRAADNRQFPFAAHKPALELVNAGPKLDAPGFPFVATISTRSNPASRASFAM